MTKYHQKFFLQFYIKIWHLLRVSGPGVVTSLKLQNFVLQLSAAGFEFWRAVRFSAAGALAPCIIAAAQSVVMFSLDVIFGLKKGYFLLSWL
jgi:hypothetical protein